jgi:hypothetical protein
MLASSTLCAQATHDNRVLLKTSEVSWNEENLGEVLGIIWKSFLILCFVLQIADLASRFTGKKLGGHGFFHACRCIVFLYGSASVFRLGSLPSNSYRGFLRGIFGEFNDEMFEGYFGSGFVGFWRNTVRIGGVSQNTPAGKDNLITNVIFFELLAFILLRVAELVTSAGRRAGNPVAHLIGGLRRIFILFFAMYFGYHAFNFLYYTHVIGKLDATNRSTFTFWLNWGVSFYVIIEGVWAMIEILIASYKGASKQENYQVTANPSASTSPVQQTYNAVVDEVAFMFQKKNIAVQSFLSKIYNFIFLLRWATYMGGSNIFDNAPIHGFVFFSVVNILIIIITIVYFKSFHKTAGILILVSEIFLLLRHLALLMFFIDRFEGRSLSQFWVDFGTHTAFWSYIIGTLIEVTLVFEPWFRPSNKEDNVVYKAASSKKRTGNIKLEKPPFDDVSNDNNMAVRKMTTYTNHKSRV